MVVYKDAKGCSALLAGQTAPAQACLECLLQSRDLNNYTQQICTVQSVYEDKCKIWLVHKTACLTKSCFRVNQTIISIITSLFCHYYSITTPIIHILAIVITSLLHIMTVTMFLLLHIIAIFLHYFYLFLYLLLHHYYLLLHCYYMIITYYYCNNELLLLIIAVIMDP